MAKAQKFGTFGGVFVPSVLTILGVIMYLRLGWVVGNAGLVGTIIIILIAHVISITTGLSVSSIATDKKVKAGGIYYMLSRSLGLPIGGAIGIALFVATALSISMYIVGFSESINSVIGVNTSEMAPLERVNYLRVTGTITLMVITTLALISTSLAIKTQYYILGFIGLSLVSVFAGGMLIDHGLSPTVRPMFSGADSAPMETVFAIFFPAVTGFTAGVAMSGDLKDPKKSIPVGTMASIGVGLVIYICLAVFLSLNVDAKAMVEDTNILSRIALFSAYGAPFLMAGIWGATLSSALGGILGGPRILQAMSLDNVTPKIFSKGVGKSNEPRNALIFAFVIAEAGILIGELDLIAPIVSMFYLTAYGFINLTCALESWSGSDFRPTFSIPRTISWLGAIATFAVMFKLDMLSMFAAFIVIGLIFLYLTRKQISMGFSDVWQGVWSEVVRLALSRINQSETDKKSWRPNVILFSGSTEKRPHLLEYATRLVGRLGLVSNFDLVEDQSTKAALARRRQVIEPADQGVGVFTRKYSCSDVYTGIERIAETYGFSGLDPNTILMGWARYTSHPVRFSRLINKFQQLDYSMLIMDYDQRVGFGNKSRIDIWTEHGGRNLSFVLTISRFFSTSDDWYQASLRLNILADTSQVDDMIIRQNLDVVQEELRIGFEVRIINTALVNRSFYQTVQYESSDADLIYLELPDLKEGEEEDFFHKTDQLCKEIGTVILYRGSSEFDDLDLGIEEHDLETIKPEDAADLNYAALAASSVSSLELPANPDMSRAMTEIHDDYCGMIDTFYQEFLIPFTNRQVHFIQSIQNNVQQFYRHLDAYEVEDHPGWSGYLDKISNEFLQAVFSQVEHFQSNQLKKQHQILTAASSHMFDSIYSTIDSCVDTFPVEYDREVLTREQTVNLDWKQRIKQLLGAKKVIYRLRYRKLVLFHFGFHLGKSLLQIQQRINQNSIQLGNDLRKTMRRMAAGIQNLKTVDAAPEITEMQQNEADQIKQRLDDLITKSGQQINAYKDFLLNDSVNRLRQVTTEMNTLTINKELKSRSKSQKKWSQYHSQVGEYLAAWNHNQPLDLNVTKLEILLLQVQIRLNKSLEVFKQQLAGIPEKRIIPKTEQLIVSLQRMMEQIKQGKHPKLTDTHEPSELAEVSEYIQYFVADSKEITDLLPGQLSVLNPEHLASDNSEEVESIEISPRDVVNYLIQNQLVTHLESNSGKFQATLGKADHNITDVMQVVSLALEDSGAATESTQDSTNLIATIQGEIDRLQDSLVQVNALINEQSLILDEKHRSVSQNLNAHSIIRSALDFNYYLMTQTQTKVINKFTKLSTNFSNAVQSGITKLYYRRSEGVIAAKRFRDHKDDVGSWVTQVSKMINLVSPKNQVIEELPFYYKQLFLRPHSVSKDLWLVKENDRRDAKEAVMYYRRVRSGGLLVLGAPLSGKSYLSEFIAHSHFEADSCFHINPTPNGSIDLLEFHRSIKKGLKYYGDIHAAFDHLAQDSVLVFHDAEKWWERSEHGFRVLDSLLDLIERYSRRVLFLVNMNIHSFHLINNIRVIEESFFKVVNTRPFNAEELKHIILSRHRTSKLKFRLEGRHEDSLSEWRLAKHFTKYFDLSGGNVGVALQQWICHIQGIASNGEITIIPAKRPDPEILTGIDRDRVIILIQFVLHKQLSMERLSRIMQTDPQELVKQIEVLYRLDFLREKNGVWEINRFLQPFLIEALKEDLLL